MTTKKDRFGSVPRYWRSLERADHGATRNDKVITVAMADWSCSREEAVRRLEEDEARCAYWVNHLYQVEVRQHEGGVQLNIRRRDGMAIHDWRHLQRIKNELVGPECEGVEVYPAESRLVDTSNKYHIWCWTDPAYRVPLGFTKRDVIEEADPALPPGMRQRAV